MPAQGQYNPKSRRAKVAAWYADHPGLHRCKDVARSLGEGTHEVAVASRNLYLQGRVQRYRQVTEGKFPVTLYGMLGAPIPPATPDPTKETAHA